MKLKINDVVRNKNTQEELVIRKGWDELSKDGADGYFLWDLWLERRYLSQKETFWDNYDVIGTRNEDGTVSYKG